MTDYSFQPAPLADERTYTLVDHRLSCRRSGGRDEWTLDLSDVDRAILVEHRQRGLVMWRLDLLSGDTLRRAALNSNAGPGALDAETYLGLVRDICTALAEAQPGFKIEIGEYGSARRVFFAMGVVCTAGGLAFLLATFLIEPSAERIAVGAAMLFMLGGLGLILLRTHNPWQDPVRIDAEKVPALTDALKERQARRSPVPAHDPGHPG
ncbi:hypothetical protein DQW77_00555 [Roseovarius sp. TE539]|uniref:hypothetical protein n=1 Tax=Roseovarius sp. TE539 TaxID=2249812 RepID=UPI000DDD0138|nr:hypothetical protein [Roseovarius sp. TE539]RBI77527.1 hypothetical protein DQW77_00555 [Roseovarius sp. TE539]